ncbi:hypothetical protein LZC95_51020 [Pendulispora brunnea]|uniref:Bacteriocin n=1 Tax=Pendulispora brunnea TaxID=2905690 RepID=A0ABZ2K7T7_9BACT
MTTNAFQAKGNLTQISDDDLAMVQGGGWKGALLKWGVRTVVGGVATWVAGKVSKEAGRATGAWFERHFG